MTGTRRVCVVNHTLEGYSFRLAVDPGATSARTLGMGTGLIGAGMTAARIHRVVSGEGVTSSAGSSSTEATASATTLTADTTPIERNGG
jgi:hypothetical protein